MTLFVLYEIMLMVIPQSIIWYPD